MCKKGIKQAGGWSLARAREVRALYEARYSLLHLCSIPTEELPLITTPTKPLQVIAILAPHTQMRA
jgi:hypothetical protein